MLSTVERTPEPGESAAFGDNPKSAALCFDRVWSLWSDGMPQEIGFAAGGGAEALALSHQWLEADSEFHPSYLDGVTVYMAAVWAGIVPDPAGTSGDDQERATPDEWGSSRHDCRSHLRWQGLAVAEALGRPVTVVFKAAETFSEEFPSPELSRGASGPVLSVLHNLRVADEDSLSWEQVIEFRRDDEARQSYRDLLNWPRRWMVDKPPNAIEDGIARKLQCYERGIRKHGVKACPGALWRLWNREKADPQLAADGIERLLAGPLGGTSSGGGLAVGPTVAKVIDFSLHLADIEQDHRDVAFVHEAAARRG